MYTPVYFCKPNGSMCGYRRRGDGNTCLLKVIQVPGYCLHLIFYGICENTLWCKLLAFKPRGRGFDYEILPSFSSDQMLNMI